MPRLFDLAAGACALTSTGLAINAARVMDTYNTPDANFGWWWQSTIKPFRLVEAVRELPYVFNPDNLGISQIQHSSLASLAWAGFAAVLTLGCLKISGEIKRYELFQSSPRASRPLYGANDKNGRFGPGHYANRRDL